MKNVFLSFYCNIFLPFYLNIVCKNIECELGLKVSHIIWIAPYLNGCDRVPKYFYGQKTDQSSIVTVWYDGPGKTQGQDENFCGKFFRRNPDFFGKKWEKNNVGNFFFSGRNFVSNKFERKCSENEKTNCDNDKDDPEQCRKDLYKRCPAKNVILWS